MPSSDTSINWVQFFRSLSYFAKFSYDEIPWPDASTEVKRISWNDTFPLDPLKFRFIVLRGESYRCVLRPDLIFKRAA
jgi:hypothetical protein